MDEGQPSTRKLLLLGATGYIGRAVAGEAVARGHQVVAVHRPGAMLEDLPREHLECVAAEVSAPGALRQALGERRFDAVISCMASRHGAPEDAWRVDHDAQCEVLASAEALDIPHFVLLSALCVQKPKLAFQEAKLAFEAKLRDAPMIHTIVRPTAFFKSLGGQVQRVRSGRPFLLFGDGRMTACKPIGADDLARFMLDCLDRRGACNATLPVGGPGPALTPREQGELLFRLTGRSPRFRHIPLWFFDLLGGALGFTGRFSSALERKAELFRIGRYYATESMLCWDRERQRYDADATPETGEETLEDFYRQVLAQGMQGQELGDHKLFR